MSNHDDIVDDLPEMRLSAAEFNQLPDYSASLPTGAYPGKTWRRLDGAFDQAFKARGGKPRWLIGRYDEIPGDASKVAIKWFRPIIAVPAASSPT
jgi:hypothetical protein